METQKYQQEIRKGLLVLAVLKVIESGRVYAGEIIKKLEHTEFATQEGTLYPLLSKLKREGLIEHEWVESPSGPPRKYFSLSPSGVELAATLTEQLRDTHELMNKLGGK